MPRRRMAAFKRELCASGLHQPPAQLRRATFYTTTLARTLTASFACSRTFRLTRRLSTLSQCPVANASDSKHRFFQSLVFTNVVLRRSFLSHWFFSLFITIFTHSIIKFNEKKMFLSLFCQGAFRRFRIPTDSKDFWVRGRPDRPLKWEVRSEVVVSGRG